jgi:hypothetical protein
LSLDAGGGNSAVVAGANAFVNSNGALGSSVFTVSFTTGLSKGSLGVSGSTATNALMVLNSVNVASTGAGTLTIILSDTDFISNGPGVLETKIGGTLPRPPGGTLSAIAWKDPSNTEWLRPDGFIGEVPEMI